MASRGREMNAPGREIDAPGREIDAGDGALAARRRGINARPAEIVARCVETNAGYAQEKGLRVYVTHLRQKIERVPTAPVLIKTEPGIGYRLGLVT